MLESFMALLCTLIIAFAILAYGAPAWAIISTAAILFPILSEFFED